MSKIVFVVALIAWALTGCASDQGSAHAPDSSIRDAHLIGTWYVASLQITGQKPIQPDSATDASMEFRRDGLVLVNGETCGAPHFTTAHGRIDLQSPTGTYTCNSSLGGTEVSIRIATDLDQLASRTSLTYALTHGRTQLTVVGGRYNAKLLRVRVPEAPVGPTATATPSIPLTHSESAVSSPPS